MRRYTDNRTVETLRAPSVRQSYPQNRVFFYTRPLPLVETSKQEVPWGRFEGNGESPSETTSGAGAPGQGENNRHPPFASSSRPQLLW